MTTEEIIKDYLLEKVIENEDVELEDILRDKKKDEDWIAQQEKQAVEAAIKGTKTLSSIKDDFEDVVVEKRDG